MITLLLIKLIFNYLRLCLSRSRLANNMKIVVVFSCTNLTNTIDMCLTVSQSLLVDRAVARLRLPKKQTAKIKKKFLFAKKTVHQKNFIFLYRIFES